jgi:hypothetical protein
MYHTKLLITRRIDGAVALQAVFSLSDLKWIILQLASECGFEDKTLVNHHSVFLFNKKVYM